MVHTSTHPQSLHHPQHESSRPLMEFRDFCFAYEDRPVLSHIDLTIDAGAEIAVLLYSYSREYGSSRSLTIRLRYEPLTSSVSCAVVVSGRNILTTANRSKSFSSFIAGAKRPSANAPLSSPPRSTITLRLLSSVIAYIDCGNAGISTFVFA